MSPSKPSKSTALRRKLPVIVAIVGSLSCILALLVVAGYFFLTPVEAAPRPLVLIHAPLDGDQLEVGQTITIHATARDENNITRLELWVDGEMAQVETSILAGGISPFPILTNWQPTSVGDHTLIVRAFNSQGARAHASITVEAVESPDRDDDGIEDEVDACPDEASPTPDGCPLPDDRDRDGVADAEDACLDEAGWPDHDGCLTPGDSDGDGVLDEEDACPEERGLPEEAGCPDRDGDSIPDDSDADPDEPGPAESGGAPDFDGDTVPDDHDLAPEEPGSPEGGGAPASDAGDSDSDGAADDVDPCPHEAGDAEGGFCPPPEDDPVPEDDSPAFDFEIPDFGMEVEIPVTVEVEAYEFSVSRDFSNVWCYVRVADSEMERYEFSPEGDRFWDIGAVLGGGNSVRLATVLSEPLLIFVNCGADTIYTGPGGGWGTVYDLGTYAYAHSSNEWDGRELLATGIGRDGEAFQARYRICVPSCEETDFQAPILNPITLGPRGEGPFNMRFRWDGTEEWITGFKLYVNGSFVDLISSRQRSVEVAAYRPSCGEVMEFEMTAFTELDDAPDRESPRSNTQVWDGLTCPRTVILTFLSFDTSAGLGSRQGPISGTFFANDEMLVADYRDGPPSFDATDDTERYLAPGQVYNIATLFADIEREAWSCVGSGCTSNYAPSTNYIEVELGPREALTFGASIWKEGGGSAFDGDAYVPGGEIVPGEYVVYDNGINMHVLVDVLVGPEAGGPDRLPDLTITDVTAAETSGQLRIHVFNNASDLVDENITVNLVRMSTNTVIDLRTWEHITIPSGSGVILQGETLTLEPYDLRVIVDPDNAIEETDDSNNIYETPVRMHVRITELHWGSPCENFLDQEAEYRFRIWVGHRPPEGDVIWIGQRNHPWFGTVDVDTSEDPWAYNEEDWVLADNPLFTFDFDMPADHNLVIMADGHEDDAGLGADDYAGNVFIEYSRDIAYGASPDGYHYAASGWHECRDAEPLAWDNNNFHIYWRITRVH
ncbi:MAG: hypothetical protein FJ010_04340 [Chloroflexi bacterium]|nr:hypothetical protein [Chloroflexota bacterium]